MSGQHYVSIDPRGRVLIPSQYRAVLANSPEDRVVMVLGSLKHIEIYTPERWEEEKASLLRNAKTKRAREWRQRIKLSTASEKVFDQAGRIRIDESLARRVKLKGKNEALVIGMVDHIEIWEPEVFDRASEEEAPYALNEYDEPEEKND